MFSKNHLSLFLAILVICLLFSSEAWAQYHPRISIIHMTNNHFFKKTSQAQGEQPQTYALESKAAPKPIQQYNH
jgi:hypothetical protein